LVYIDLVGAAEEDARKRLLDGVRDGRAKPLSPPSFQGILPIPWKPTGTNLRLPDLPRSSGRDDEVLSLF